MRIQRGTGVWSPMKNYKNIGFLAILVRIPCKTTKLPSQHSMFGHHRPTSKTSFYHVALNPMENKQNFLHIFSVFLLSQYNPVNMSSRSTPPNACSLVCCVFDPLITTFAHARYGYNLFFLILAKNIE